MIISGSGVQNRAEINESLLRRLKLILRDKTSSEVNLQNISGKRPQVGSYKVKIFISTPGSEAA